MLWAKNKKLKFESILTWFINILEKLKKLQCSDVHFSDSSAHTASEIIWKKNWSQNKQTTTATKKKSDKCLFFFSSSNVFYRKRKLLGAMLLFGTYNTYNKLTIRIWTIIIKNDSIVICSNK